MNEFFIHGSDILTPYLASLFNFVFDSGVFPEDWCDGLLIPLHKKGSKHIAENYRGITLLSALRKLFIRVLNNRLDAWSEMYGIYVEAQNGFRRGRGTVDSAFGLYSIVNEYLEQGKKLYTFFIDYSKAFDYIVHDNLWYKLLNLGVHGKIIDIVRSMYSQVRNKVFNNNEKSETFTCKLGVRQGECLSPFLFSLYVNDLESHLAGQGAGVSIFDVKFLLLLYADDVIFIRYPQSLQSQINKLFVYCQRWKLSFNTKKSQIIVFKKGNHPCVHKWYYGDEEISVLRSLSNLVIVFSSNGKVVKTQATLADQANKAIFQLHKILNRLKTLRVSFALDLFDKLITPILCYGCEV